jgi:hypothetical protein
VGESSQRREKIQGLYFSDPLSALKGMRWMSIVAAAVAAAIFVAPFSQAQEDPRLPLDELLATPISTAAKYEQNLSAVAASATVITSEEDGRRWIRLCARRADFSFPTIARMHTSACEA